MIAGHYAPVDTFLNGWGCEEDLMDYCSWHDTPAAFSAYLVADWSTL